MQPTVWNYNPYIEKPDGTFKKRMSHGAAAGLVVLAAFAVLIVGLVLVIAVQSAFAFIGFFICFAAYLVALFAGLFWLQNKYAAARFVFIEEEGRLYRIAIGTNARSGFLGANMQNLLTSAQHIEHVRQAYNNPYVVVYEVLEVLEMRADNSGGYRVNAMVWLPYSKPGKAAKMQKFVVNNSYVDYESLLTALAARQRAPYA